MSKLCKTCKYKTRGLSDWPCVDCCEGDRYEDENKDKCHPYERPYGSDERDYYE